MNLCCATFCARIKCISCYIAGFRETLFHPIDPFSNAHTQKRKNDSIKNICVLSLSPAGSVYAVYCVNRTLAFLFMSFFSAENEYRKKEEAFGKGFCDYKYFCERLKYTLRIRGFAKTPEFLIILPLCLAPLKLRA